MTPTDVLVLFTQCLSDGVAKKQWVLCDLEVGLQNGKVASVRDTLDDAVPADLISRPQPMKFDDMTKIIDEQLKSACAIQLFGVLKFQVAINPAGSILAYRTRRERVTKK